MNVDELASMAWRMHRTHKSRWEPIWRRLVEDLS